MKQLTDLPLISIITPSYNQGEFIEQTIDSVLSQGYPNLEYMIIDGGSDDNTVEIIKRYNKYLTYWISEKDKGQSEAINKGFNRVTGEVVNWLNSDDYYEPGILFKVGEAFLNKNVNVFCGRSKVFGNGVSYQTNGTDIYSGNLFRTIGQARIDQPETFFRFNALQKIGFVNESLHFVMDKELWIRYLIKYGLDNVVKTTDIFVNYRHHHNSKTVSLQEKFAEETRNIYYTFSKWFSLERYSKFLEDRYPVKILALSTKKYLDREFAYRIVNYYFMEQAMIYYAKDSYDNAREFINYIDFNAIEKFERNELYKLNLKMRLPVSLKQLFHRFKDR